MKKTVMICATILALVATVACKSKVIIEDTAHFPDSEIVKSSEASEEDEEFLCVSRKHLWRHGILVSEWQVEMDSHRFGCRVNKLFLAISNNFYTFVAKNN